MTTPVLRIATRGSPLALAQAQAVRDLLAAAHPDLAASGRIELVVMKTTGDRELGRPLAEIGGKGLFTKELETALVEERVDIAVHSMKDVPTVLPEGLAIVATPPREDPRDAVVTGDGGPLAGLPAGARVGTSGLRRQAQVLARYPHLRVTPLRGNVHTRLAKLEAGEVEAILLAVAGLRRLDLTHVITEILPPSWMLPAVAQGAIGIEARVGDHRVRDWLAAIHCPATELRIGAERALLAELDGSCRTPIAALATLEGRQLTLEAKLLSRDGRLAFSTRITGDAGDAVRIGTDAGRAIRRQLPPGTTIAGLTA